MKKLKICEYCQNEFNPKESHSQLYCSSQCLYQGKRRKTLETNRKRYGCDAPAQNSQIKQKVKSYFVEKFGVENPFQNQDIKEKIRSSNLERYGVENVQRSQVVREKTRRTCIQKYGGNSPMASSSVKDKIKQTNIERYGCQNVFANEDIKKKMRQTWIKNYGTDHPMKNLNMRKNRDDLLELKYGVDHPIKCSELSSRFNTYVTHEYILPSNKIIKLQGYESKTLDQLLLIYAQEDILYQRKDMPDIQYYDPLTEKWHRYYPDFFIPKQNLIIQTKSKYTLEKQAYKNCLKINAVFSNGYNFKLYIH